MRCRISLGKVAYYGTRKVNPAYIEVELKQRGGEQTNTGKKCVSYWEFTASGEVLNQIESDFVICGQCLDIMNGFMKLRMNPDFKIVYDWWKKYHLNGMHAGMPEQEQALMEKFGNLRANDYDKHCDYLKEIGLYEVPYGSRRTIGTEHQPDEMYRYGHGWVIQDIPDDVILNMQAFIVEHNENSGVKTW